MTGWRTPRRRKDRVLLPSYTFRQLYDFRHGARSGEWSPLMAQVVSNLDQDDMLAIVAYLASTSVLPPVAAPSPDVRLSSDSSGMADIPLSPLGAKHEVAALQPAARGQEPRGS
jgi:hypothetical protein